MTKKRFVKLVMSHGIQRNKAQEIAANFNKKNIPYEKAYSSFKLFKGLCNSLKGVAKAFNDTVAEIRKTSIALAQFTKAIEKEGLNNKG